MSTDMPSMSPDSPAKSLCAAIPGAAANAGGAPADESLALAVTVFAFLGAAMWVFHRFGHRRETARHDVGGRVAGPAPATS